MKRRSRISLTVAIGGIYPASQPAATQSETASYRGVPSPPNFNLCPTPIEWTAPLYSQCLLEKKGDVHHRLDAALEHARAYAALKNIHLATRFDWLYEKIRLVVAYPDSSVSWSDIRALSEGWVTTKQSTCLAATSVQPRTGDIHSTHSFMPERLP